MTVKEYQGLEEELCNMLITFFLRTRIGNCSLRASNTLNAFSAGGARMAALLLDRDKKELKSIQMLDKVPRTEHFDGALSRICYGISCSSNCFRG
jgi:hypothetical protein